MTWTEAQRRVKRREYDRLYKSGPASGVRVGDARLHVPDNVQRVHAHTPCTRCGSRAGCTHRPWLGADRLEVAQ